jgi:hypothetical protein
VTGTDRPSRLPGFRVQQRSAKKFELFRDEQVVCVVNKTAIALLDLCDGMTTIDEMVFAVEELFGLESFVAQSHVHRTLSQLAGAGVVQLP